MRAAPTVLGAAIERRAVASEAFFPEQAGAIARLCSRMAERFLAGGRLLAYGRGAIALSDVRHVAVEFVHPVIVGKRALPALGITAPGEFALLAEPGDMLMAFGEAVQVAAVVRRARDAGCLTIAFAAGAGAEHHLVPPTDDPLIAQELVETTYHVLWELVHVFFEHRGVHSESAGAASFLYPFLSGQAVDRNEVVADVARSVVAKAEEVQELRERTVIDGARALEGAAGAIREAFVAGGRLLALGNGGSATDAMDLVADFGAAGFPAVDLTADTAIITAIANDIGPEAIFARQVIAHGRAGDVLVALSTSGSSLSVIAALQEARRRAVTTIALVGYDGGRIAAERLADHLVITPSQHIPRIQEAQATASHVLAELIGRSRPRSDP